MNLIDKSAGNIFEDFPKNVPSSRSAIQATPNCDTQLEPRTPDHRGVIQLDNCRSNCDVAEAELGGIHEARSFYQDIPVLKLRPPRNQIGPFPC